MAQQAVGGGRVAGGQGPAQAAADAQREGPQEDRRVQGSAHGGGDGPPAAGGGGGDEQGELVGFDVDIAKAVAQKLNLKPEFVLTEWSGILAGLQSNKYDVIVNQVGITAERQKTIAFSEAYTYSRPQIAVHATRGQEYKSLADLKGKNFVLGGQAAPVAGLDLRTLGVVLEKNGEPVAVGAGAAVLGHPAAAIAALANHLGARGEEIPAGTMILSGGVTEAVAVQAGDSVNLRIQSLGSVSTRFI